ncbi:MAG TPA: hypothetical protein VMH00_02590 [Candidatus Limnocylindrales bacterium]|nr:hypothetical protein [Candidatus Limnocylindrales bacterium]
MTLSARRVARLLLIATFALPSGAARIPADNPGSRSVMDAHNCYPYFEWWSDRIDRALSAGTPLAIEQDLYWYTDPKTGKSWSVVAHGAPVSGQEPTMEHYFFDRIRPVVERALKEGNHGDWPVITLNLDFKTEEPEHLQAVWSLLEKYRDWLTTAPREKDGSIVEPLDVRPVLVLTGESDAQERVFYDQVPVGGRLLVFGAVHTHTEDPTAAPDVLEPARATNYRRWWNNSWKVVERGGQTKAGAWDAAYDRRLRSLVQHAHANGLWIRFYTLDGASPSELSCHGWFRSYDFGSLAAVKIRWRAAAEAGVDYIATDQYERLGAYLRTREHTAKR